MKQPWYAWVLLAIGLLMLRFFITGDLLPELLYLVTGKR